MEPPVETVQESAPPPAEEPASTARPFDFRRPVFLSSGQWRRLRMELDEFAESLAAMLSTYLRLDFGLQVMKVHSLTFNEFTASLPVPTQLILFKADPLRGISIIDVQPAIGLAVVDRLLGGPGQASAPERNLTEMEVALLDQFAEIILSEWCKHWAPVQELKAQILGHENNARFLQTSSGGSIMLSAVIEVRMGESAGQIQLVFPFPAIEPLVARLGHEIQAQPAPAPVPSAPVAWNRALDGLPLTLAARWPASQVTTRAILNLKPGEILELDPELAERIELRIGASVKFEGRLGARGGKRAVQITNILKT